MLATTTKTAALPLLQQTDPSVTSQTQPTFSPISTPAPLPQLLQPGLSPVFATDSPASFYRYLQYISNTSVCAPSPTGLLTAGVLTLAISYPCTQSLSTTSNVLLTPSVIANISIAVPAFAKHYGYNRFQIWIDISLFQHRRMHPHFHYCTRRIVPFLSLPVLHVPASSPEHPASPDPDFRTSLQALAASLGRGRFIATFTSNSSYNTTSASASFCNSSGTTANTAVVFHYEGCDRRRDTLRTRFDALIFTVIATGLLQLPGICPTERRYFQVAANVTFSHIHSLPALIPPLSRHLRNCVVWTHAAFVNPLHFLRALTNNTHPSPRICQESAPTKISLQEVFSAWSAPNTPGAAARQLRVARKDGREHEWILVCTDASTPSLAMIMELARGVPFAQDTPNISADSDYEYELQSKPDIPNLNTERNTQRVNNFYDVTKSCLCVMDEPAEFLDLTCDIAQTMASENEPFKAAVEDILVDCGVLEQGESVLDADLLQISEIDDLSCSAVTSPSWDGLFF